MSRVSLEMKYHTGERLNVVGLRLAVLQCTIPYCSFSIAKWVFIAYSRRPYLVPNSQQESNNKFILASNLDNPNHWLYDTQKWWSLDPASSIAPISSLLRSGTCSVSWNSLIRAIWVEVLLWMSIVQVYRWRTLSLLLPSAIPTLIEPGLQ